MKKLITLIAAIFFVAFMATSVNAEYNGDAGWYEKTKGGNTGEVQYFSGNNGPNWNSAWTKLDNDPSEDSGYYSDAGESWRMNNGGYASGGGSADMNAQGEYNSDWNYGWSNDVMVHGGNFHPGFKPRTFTNMTGIIEYDGSATGTFKDHQRNINNSVTATGDSVDMWTRNDETYRGNSGYIGDSNFVTADQQDGNTKAFGISGQSGYVEYDARAKGADGGSVSGNADSRGTQAAGTYANEGDNQSTAAMFAGSSSARIGNAYSSLDGAGHLNTEVNMEASGSVGGGTFAAHSGNQAWTSGSAEFAYGASVGGSTQYVTDGGSSAINVSKNGGAFTYGASTVGPNSANAWQKSISTTGGDVSVETGIHMNN